METDAPKAPALNEATLLELVEELKRRLCSDGDTFEYRVLSPKVVFAKEGDTPPPPPNGD